MENMSTEITRSDIFKIIQNNILEVLPKMAIELISLEKNLSNLGANSVDRIEIITLSMSDLGVKIALLNFANVNNIYDLVEVLFNNLNTK